MPRQIMVPLDGSRFSEQALAYAMQIARRSAARVHLVRVHTDSMVLALAPFPAPFDPVLDQELRESENGYLAEIAATWTDAGIDVCIATPVGPTTIALSEYAADAGIDLIVMTTHGRGGISRAWLGSVADRLVRSTNTPVVLLRPNASGNGAVDPAFHPLHILIPLDGSELSETIIEPALRLGRLAGARYTLMQVVLPPIDVSADLMPYEMAEHAALRTAAVGYLETWANRLRASGCTVDTKVVVQANPAAGIVEEALTTECDLISMATHGRSGWTRAALGSVADKVLRLASSPLLTMRPEIADAAV